MDSQANGPSSGNPGVLASDIEALQHFGIGLLHLG